MSRRSKTASTPRPAYSTGLDLLARRDHSARELKTKLVARGHAKGEVGEAVERLKGQRYQSDERFGETLARSRAAHGYGPRRIEAELKSHGLSAAAIREAIDACMVDWRSSALAQLRKRFGGREPVDATERTRRAQFLLRRGFDPATVRAATRAEVEDPGEEFD